MKKTNQYNYPDKNGFFGVYGGKFVPPQLDKVLTAVEEAYLTLRQDSVFQLQLNELYRTYANRPSLLYKAERLTQEIGGASIYLKREDLNHTGAHKINNTLGQALVAKYLGKKKLIAETGAGQHGVAVATVAARFGMTCDIYMGKRDVTNQAMNMYRMKMLGANVIEVSSGQATLKDAIDEALMAFIREPDTYYMLGSAVGPHPYPMMVRDFQAVIGREARQQILDQEGRLPDYLIACVGGGSNAIGLFYSFIEDETVQMIAVEPEGLGRTTKKHGLALMKGRQGIIHGFKCLVLQNAKGEIVESYSAASGLDYPGVGPEFCLLKDLGRVETVGITDKVAAQAFVQLTRTEGIIPALESAHAVAYAIEKARSLSKEKIIIVNLSGRGDKDVQHVYEQLLPKYQIAV